MSFQYFMHERYWFRKWKDKQKSKLCSFISTIQKRKRWFDVFIDPRVSKLPHLSWQSHALTNWNTIAEMKLGVQHTNGK